MLFTMAALRKKRLCSMQTPRLVCGPEGSVWLPNVSRALGIPTSLWNYVKQNVFKNPIAVILKTDDTTNFCSLTSEITFGIVNLIIPGWGRPVLSTTCPTQFGSKISISESHRREDHGSKKFITPHAWHAFWETEIEANIFGCKEGGWIGK